MGTGPGGTVTQPATIASAATAAHARTERDDGNRKAMEWIFLEVLVALAIAVAIVAWTMGGRRREPPGGTTDDSSGTPRR